MIVEAESKGFNAKYDTDDFQIEFLSLLDIYTGLEEFIEENFRGAVRFKKDKSDIGYIKVATSSLALFIKLLLGDIFGESVADMEISAEDGMFFLRTSWKKKRPLTSKTIATLSIIANDAGFDFSIEEHSGLCEILISAKTVASNVIPLYARDQRKMYYALERIFFMIPIEQQNNAKEQK